MLNLQQGKQLMAKLTSKTRNALPKSDFGLPGKRAYPMPDASHAANAKARASQAVKAGRMSPSTEAKIDAKANAKLGHGGDRKSIEHHMTQAVNHMTGAVGNIQKALEKRLSQRDK